MNRTQLVQLLADRLDIPKTKANLLLDTLSEVATDSLRKDKVFVLPGLVKFALKDKAATAERKGVNPFTKEQITIPAKPASQKVKAAPIGDLKKAFAPA